MMKTVRALQARADAAKLEMEAEVSKLYDQFHSCTNPEKRVEIKKCLDEMIRKVEEKKESTKVRSK